MKRKNKPDVTQPARHEKAAGEIREEDREAGEEAMKPIKCWLREKFPGHPYWAETSIHIPEVVMEEDMRLTEGFFITQEELERQLEEAFAKGLSVAIEELEETEQDAAWVLHRESRASTLELVRWLKGNLQRLQTREGR